MALAYGMGGLIQVPEGALYGEGEPSTNLKGEAGQNYVDRSTDPYTLYTFNGQTWQSGGNAAATETTAGIIRIATDAEATTGTDDTIAMTPYTVGLVAIAGAPDATEVTKGIAQLATTAEAETGTNDTDIMTPLKTAALLDSGNHPGTFTTLDASGAVTFASTGAISMTSDTASLFDVTGAGVDLTLSSDAGRVIVNGEEAADNAITLLSAAGGIDADAALQINIASSENAADAIVINASAGGIDITAAGGAAEDIDITNTSGSVNITAGENVATAIVMNASAGGIDLTAAGAAGEDIDIVNTAGSVNISGGEAAADALTLAAPAGGITATSVGQIAISTSQNAADAMVLTASAGGIDILATGAATEDIDIINTGGSVNITATENAAEAIYIRANGGTSETIRIHADQGTGVASINIGSDVGGVTISSALESADSINITASGTAGGIDIDAGTAGVIVDTTGGISLDAAAASNFTATGAFDVTINSTAGSVIINAEEAATDAIDIQTAAGGIDINAALEINIDSSEAAVADAIRIVASAADGGIDIDAGTGGITIDTTDAFSIDGAAASNVTVTGAGLDLTLSSVGGSVVVASDEAVSTAIGLTASDAAGGITLTAGTGNVNVAGNLVLSSVATQLQMNGGAVTDFLGQSTLTNGTVTVSNTNIATTDRIFLSRADENSSSALGSLTITALTASTSFVITALDPADGSSTISGDTSIVNWFIVRQN